MNWIPLRTVARPVTMLLVGMSVLVLLRGHDEPGGGFIAGLLAAAGFVVDGLAHGPAHARQLLRTGPLGLLATGLLLAALSGVPGLLGGGAYLQARWWGELLTLGKVGTVLLFDIGVYLVVLGAVSLILLGALDPARDEKDGA
jgi:multisubunit Na+/H+ antiporter MnhB subunit